MKETKTNQKTKVDNDHSHVEPRVEAAVVESRGKQSEMFRLCGETDWSSTAEDWNWSHVVGFAGVEGMREVDEKVVWSSGGGVVAKSVVLLYKIGIIYIYIPAGIPVFKYTGLVKWCGGLFKNYRYHAFCLIYKYNTTVV